MIECNVAAFIVTYLSESYLVVLQLAWPGLPEMDFRFVFQYAEHARSSYQKRVIRK